MWPAQYLVKPEWHFRLNAIFGGGLVIFRGRINISWSCRVTFRGRWLHTFYVGNVFFPFRPACPGTTYSMESRFHSYITSKDTSDEGRATATRKPRRGACHSQAVQLEHLFWCCVSFLFKAFCLWCVSPFWYMGRRSKIGRKNLSQQSWQIFHLGWSFRSSEWLIQYTTSITTTKWTTTLIWKLAYLKQSYHKSEILPRCDCLVYRKNMKNWNC